MNELEITSLINTVFGTPHGKKLLDHLNKTITDRPTYKKGMTLDECAFNEGQKNIIKQISKEVGNATL